MSSIFTVLLVIPIHLEICENCVHRRDSPERNEKTVRRNTRVWVSASRCLVFVFFPPSPSCFGVPSSQMDAVRQLNDACFPSLALAAAAVYMQSRRQTSCKTHVLIYVGALRNYTNITLLTAHINAPATCNESRFIRGEVMLSISDDGISNFDATF